jgi:hypothetical protein
MFDIVLLEVAPAWELRKVFAPSETVSTVLAVASEIAFPAFILMLRSTAARSDHLLVLLNWVIVMETHCLD